MDFIKLNDELALKGQLTPEELQQAAGAGFKSVLNLRSSDEEDFLSEEQQQAESVGLEYLNTPVNPAKINHELINQLMQDIDGLTKPTLIHCKSGMRANLIGLIYVATNQGMTAEEALETGKKLGLNFDNHPQFKQLIETYIADV
ncbi:MAG: protein tyrosine phosphatase family protein [Nostocaceae cyanobacterium]|nr:protein tyrosine phosphatase family protein [Nostocaceae cyanobacterium]